MKYNNTKIFLLYYIIIYTLLYYNFYYTIINNTKVSLYSLFFTNFILHTLYLASGRVRNYSKYSPSTLSSRTRFSHPVTLTSFGTISAHLADIVPRRVWASVVSRFGYLRCTVWLPTAAIVMQMLHRFVVEQRIEVAPPCHYDDDPLAMKNYAGGGGTISVF